MSSSNVNQPDLVSEVSDDWEMLVSAQVHLETNLAIHYF